MLALQATTDELQKYDLVTEHLLPHAGPQCYPHVDANSADYRIKGTAPGQDAAADVPATSRAHELCTVGDEQCWLCWPEY